MMIKFAYTILYVEDVTRTIGFYEKALNADTCFEIKANPAIAHFFVNDGTFN